MVGKKRDKPATGGFRKNYDGQTLWYADYELDTPEDYRDIIRAGGLTPTAEFVSAIKEEISNYVFRLNFQQDAPHGGGSGRTNDFWEEHALKMIEIYESFGGTFGLGRKNPGRGNEEGSVGSLFLSFALAINEALPKEFRRIGTDKAYAGAIRRAYQNAKSR